MRIRSVTSLGVLLMLIVGLLPTVGTAAQPWPAPEIVNGSEVSPEGKYPFLVALVRANNANEFSGEFCGGAIVTASWVLTAAHCVEGSGTNEPDEIDVVVGRHEIDDDTQGERIDVIS